MAPLSDSFPSPNNSIEIANGTIDEFIDSLQLTWAVNAAEGVVELALLRVIGQTVSPETIYIRIGNELKLFDRPDYRAANPLFHTILLCCYQLIQGWADEGWFEYLPTIEQTLRDVLHMDARRRAGAVGLSARRDLELYQSLENAMYADHRLRMRVDTQVNILEGVIAKMKAAESNHGKNDDFEMGNREEIDKI